MRKSNDSVPSWFFEQSSVIPWRRHHRGVEILLITTPKTRRWIFPKGVIDPGLTARTAARKEATEEAGIDGIVSETRIGEYTYEKWKGTCRVQVFAMKVTEIHDSWEEDHLRHRKWVSLKEAHGLLDRRKLRHMLRRFEERLDELIS
ncbi:MAG: NUDIX hydrolase [Bacteroidetes bacterium]|nr:NUDIX hydrolase [Bacteroidota bacterium]